MKNAQDPAELRKFQKLAPIFRKHATQYNLDYLLLIAQGYQESGLDQQVKSPVGAVGIMQVMPRTAAAAPVKIPNIHTEENNIHAGVRLIHFLVNDYFNQPELDQINRTLFAIAAYNAGPAKITKCRKVAEEMGYDPNKWFGNVEVATAKLVGRETTQYVANIYKYYIAYRLAVAQLRNHMPGRTKRCSPEPGRYGCNEFLSAGWKKGSHVSGPHLLFVAASGATPTRASIGHAILLVVAITPRPYFSFPTCPKLPYARVRLRRARFSTRVGYTKRIRGTREQGARADCSLSPFRVQPSRFLYCGALYPLRTVLNGNMAAPPRCAHL